MPKVLISDKMDPQAAAIFRERGVEVDEITGKTPDELKAIIGQYDGLAIRSSTKVTKDILDAATNLKVVGRAGIGVDNVDIPAASAKGVVVMNTPFGNSITTAEHAIALMFALARQLPEADASTQAGKWEKNRFMGVELTGKTLGLIGAGNIGSIVADRALGLRMKVVAYDPFLTDERAVELGVTKATLDELLARADFITLHTPLTDQTRNILSAENIAKMSAGQPLDDDDRGPWLESIGRFLAEHENGAIVGCSALKHSYREIIRAAAPDTVFVHLHGSYELLKERMSHRVGHFMPVSLLDSQFETLEDLRPEEAGLVLDVSAAPEDLAAAAAEYLRA